MGKFLIKDKLAILLLFIPILIRWMPYRNFPITIDIYGFPVFWPIIFYILYFILTSRGVVPSVFLKIAQIYVMAFFIMTLDLFFIEKGRNFLGLFIENSVFYLLLFILLYRPPKRCQLNYIKWLVVFLYIYIVAQALLSAVGIWQIVEVEYESTDMLFFRARTKAGDSNETSLVLLFLTFMITGYYNIKKPFKYFTLFLTFVTISMCAVRGSFIIISLYILFYMYRDIKSTQFKYKVFTLFVIVGAIYYVSQNQILGDIFTRTENLNDSGNLTANRDILILGSINHAFKDSPLFGVGQGRVYPSTKELSRYRDMENKTYSQYTSAPHNLWVVVLCEFGIIGFFGLLYIVFLTLRCFDYTKSLSWAMLFFYLISMNTETVMIFDEVFLFVIITLICTYYISNNQYECNINKLKFKFMN